MTKDQADFYVLITDGDCVDQIAQGESNAKREKRDLEKMGCSVTMLGPVSARLADNMVTCFLTKPSIAQLRRMIREAGR